MRCKKYLSYSSKKNDSIEGLCANFSPHSTFLSPVKASPLEPVDAEVEESTTFRNIDNYLPLDTA